MKKIIISILMLTLLLVGIQSASAAPMDTVNDITDKSQEALNNASKVANETAQEVEQTLDPIQSILNSINSIIQQIQQIMNAFGGGQ